ncbi:MAG: PEGA domain-containing protein, partial [Deltaproteobacteria bacterium]|nr:PEGA domain-containing protein [Deltaproteobacteria bacterium]
TDSGDTYQYADGEDLPAQDRFSAITAGVEKIPPKDVIAGKVGGRGEDSGVDQGYLNIKTAPLGATGVIDGREVSNMPTVPLLLPAGTHRVKINQAGYKSVELEVRVRGGELTEVGFDPDEVPLDKIQYIAAQGYFANTYLPGDPVIEWLQQKLQTGLFLRGEELTLERAATPYLQPFDSPEASGLDVFLSTDRNAVEGPARLTLQIGLKGSLRHAGRRAPLNAAILVDLRTAPSEKDRRIIWTIVDSIATNQQAGDHFSLVVAGVKDPLRVKHNRFDLVSVRRNLASALQDIEESGVAGNLQTALNEAFEVIGGEGVDDAPLGANQVFLISAAAIDERLDILQTMTHRQAVLGINLTTLGVGSAADMEALGALALAGQGRRRLVVDLKQARSVVEAELAASGRIVARAVRLRIRLAEGVKLVEVLGSHPLDSVRSERVREAEQAIDRRVAKTLGIEADRGEDEDGIQIVIPAYYAGDDHVVLLDVVVPGPGYVADVRVRYKDLVGLRNAVANASLSVPAGTRPDDPLTCNVRKNLLAFRMSQDLQTASEQLKKGQIGKAQQTIARASARVRRLQGRFPEFIDDPELGKDIAMLAEYVKVLGDHPNWQHNQQVRTHLIRSLAYASKVKLPPRVSK